MDWPNAPTEGFYGLPMYSERFPVDPHLDRQGLLARGSRGDRRR